MLKWTVRWLLTYYYIRGGILCATFDKDDWSERKEKSFAVSCWSLSVYLVDCGHASPSELRRSILGSAEDEPVLKLVRKPEAFGWIHLWQYPDGESAVRMSPVQELPPVWNHRIVTEDSVHVNDNGLLCNIVRTEVEDDCKVDISIKGLRVGCLPKSGRIGNGWNSTALADLPHPFSRRSGR